LFKAKNQNTAHDLVKTILDAHLSSQEEGIFGGFLEELAIFICERVYGGKNHQQRELTWNLKIEEHYILFQ
jgi:hypothetical protein